MNKSRFFMQNNNFCNEHIDFSMNKSIFHCKKSHCSMTKLIFAWKTMTFQWKIIICRWSMSMFHETSFFSLKNHDFCMTTHNFSVENTVKNEKRVTWKYRWLCIRIITGLRFSLWWCSPNRWNSFDFDILPFHGIDVSPWTFGHDTDTGSNTNRHPHQNQCF